MQDIEASRVDNIINFYVLTGGGLCVYSNVSVPEVEKSSDRVGAHFSLFDLWSKYEFGSGIYLYVLRRAKIIVQESQGMLFVAKISKDARLSSIRKKLAKFIQAFFVKFPPTFFNDVWKGDLEIFENVDQIFNRYLGMDLFMHPRRKSGNFASSMLALVAV